MKHTIFLLSLIFSQVTFGAEKPAAPEVVTDPGIPFVDSFTLNDEMLKDIEYLFINDKKADVVDEAKQDLEASDEEIEDDDESSDTEAVVDVENVRPVSEVEQAIGKYSRGKLVNPVELPLETDNYVKLFRYRNSFYAAVETARMIEEISRHMNEVYPDGERLQVGDISKKGGGKLLKHNSHQIGLDVDIIYYRNNMREQDPDQHGFGEKFVHRKKVTKNFDLERNFELIKTLANHPNVDRMFVDKAIKKALMSYAKKNDLYEENEIMFLKMRHIKKHGDHVHVRLKCPASSPRCISQKPIEELD